jgi:hypothetical protein
MGEPLQWTATDRARAMAYEQWLRERCGNCGTTEGEWRDLATKREHDPPPFVPEAHRCTGCATKAALAEELRGRHDFDSAGIVIHLRPFDPARDGVEDEELTPG